MPFNPEKHSIEEWKEDLYKELTIETPCVHELQTLEYDKDKLLEIWKMSSSNAMDLNVFYRHDLDEEAWNKDAHGQDNVWPEIKLTRMKHLIDNDDYIPQKMVKQFHPDTRPYYWDFAQHDAGWAMHKHYDWRITGLVIPLLGGCPVIRYFSNINSRRFNEDGTKMKEDWMEVLNHQYSGPCLLNGKEFHSADALPERRLIMHFMFDQTVEEIREKNPHLWNKDIIPNKSLEVNQEQVTNLMPENYGISY
jgi:hypothetical protein